MPEKMQNPKQDDTKAAHYDVRVIDSLELVIQNLIETQKVE
jgi:hypothetical protein